MIVRLCEIAVLHFRLRRSEGDAWSASRALRITIAIAKCSNATDVMEWGDMKFNLLRRNLMARANSPHTHKAGDGEKPPAELMENPKGEASMNKNIPAIALALMLGL